MTRLALAAFVSLTIMGGTAAATTFRFASDPFAGSNAPTTDGRQIVGNEKFITFDVATDNFSIDPATFGVSDSVLFLKDLAANVPSGGINVIVLQDTPVPFAAGIAANLIADQVTDPGPGFFIYFNSGLDLPRLVYSTDLSDNTADLKILARMTNLGGQPGRDTLPLFAASNFAFVPVPEPATLATASAGFLVLAGALLLRRGRRD